MIDDTETDFCDRLPGQHTGRLSLELQASEAAEWQMRLEQMEKETQRLRHRIARQEEKIRELTAAPAAGESAPISHEVPQAHGLTTPATPSAAEGRKENQDTITGWANATFGPADSNIRIAARANEEMAELLRALSADDDNPKAAEEIADVVIVLYRVASRLGYDLHRMIDKKMEINRGREWKLDNTGHGYHVRNKSVTPTETPTATPSAAAGAGEPGAGGKLRPEVGKRYLRRDGKVSGVLRVTPATNPHHKEFPLFDFENAVSYDIAGGCDPFAQRVEDLIAEHREPVPSPPAKSAPIRCVPDAMTALGRMTNEQCKAIPEKPAESPSAAVGASAPDAGDAVSRVEYDRVVRIMNHFRDVIAEYHDMTVESSDVSGEIRGLTYALEWIDAKRDGNPKLKAAAREMLNDMQVHYEAAVARLRDGESINSTSRTDVPVESPDDWVTQDRVSMRKCDQIRWINVDTDLPFSNHLGEWSDVVGTVRQVSHGFIDSGKYRLEIRCRRKYLPVVPDESPSLPSPWRPMTEKPTCDWFWLVWKGGDMSVFHRLDDIPFYGAIAWQLIEKPQYPNAAPADKPRMRQVTLREYRHTNDEFAWTSCSGYLPMVTGRTQVVEVPE